MSVSPSPSMAGGGEMSALASRRGRGYWAGTRPHWLLLVSVVAACLSTTHAAAFANSARLMTAVEKCLSKVSTGERCCKPVSDPLGGGGADCGDDAGTALMADWDTSLVTDMSGLFSSKGDFNQDISGWDVSKVTDMSDMFQSANDFNQDLSSWKVGAVTDMNYMFQGANRFANTADLSGWDVSKVTNMNGMFSNAQKFNATGLGSWDVSKVTDMSYMFNYASKFNDDISNWNVGQVQQMYGMFYGARIFNADITGWKPKTECTDAERNSGNCYIHEGNGHSNHQDMFRGASMWIDAYTNCGFDNSDNSVCPAATYPSSSSFYDGPPNAWTAGMPVGCSGGTASPFLSSAALIVAMERCLLKVSSGEACCSTGGANCGAACGVDMADWDTSLVTDMSGLFSNKGDFNQNISGWDVSKVTDMSGMFQYAYDFNQDLSSWNVGAVTDMNYMFNSAQRFANTADLSGWDVSKVTNMNGMFNGASYFNATGLGSWDVSKVTDMSYMFSSASKFNDDISNWNVGQVQQMYGMFYDARIFNADITGWKPKTECTDAERNSGNCWIHEGSDHSNHQDMFKGASMWIDAYTNCGFDDSDNSVCPAATYPSSSSFYDGPPNAWTAGMPVGCSGGTASAFLSSAALIVAVERCLLKVSSGEACCSTGGANCGAACGVDMPSWDTSLVTDMSGLFSGKYSFDQDISGWDVSKVTDMSDMFQSANDFNQDLSSWNVGAVTDMNQMFSGAQRFALTADLSGWDVSKVTKMNSMFNGASYFNATGLGSWDVSKVTDMSYMFNYASKFNDDISNWNVGQVQQMYGMFYGASIFNADITGWRPKTECTDAERNSGNCWIWEGQSNHQDMFRGASMWIDAYTNCGFDNSDNSVCPAATYPSSSSFYDGPPNAWEPSTCDASVAPEHGAVGDCSSSLQIGDSCQPICSSGFNPSGPHTCSLGGVLSMVVCLDTSGGPCDASAPPENGAVGTCTSSLTSGTICQPTCGSGYTASGFSYCSGGTFTPATCVGDPCDEVLAPANGGDGNCTRSLSSGSTCRPTCKTGYSLSGDHSCALGVLTSGTCDPDPCDASAPPTNGAAGTCASDLASGSTCQPECDRGYYASGPSSCLAGRLTAALCSDQPPSAPPPPPNLILDDDDFATSLTGRVGALVCTLLVLLVAM